MTYVSILIGGAAGALARFLLSNLVQHLFPSPFPWGTLSVNLIGSFLLGALAAPVLGSTLDTQTKLLLTTGFLGAFTTFSTYMLDALLLIQHGEWQRAVMYLLGSTLLGLFMVWAGYTAVSTLRSF